MGADPVKLELDLSWPALPLDAWLDTYATLHMWTQIAGKIRMTLCPPVNHLATCELRSRPSAAWPRWARAR